jgi:FtsH-binding integral membrane protein
LASRVETFAPFHRWDRNFYLAWLCLCWLGVIFGFYPAVSGRLAGRADYTAPLILHIHVLSFTLWLILLATQILLVRSRRVTDHRRLGLAGAALIPVMVLSGFFSEVYSQRFYLAHPPDSQAFFILPVFYVIAFGALAAAAIQRRRDPSAHKRLMYVATTVVVGAAYARWWGASLAERFGDGFWGLILHAFAGTNLLLAAALAHDLVTRGRLHRVLAVIVPVLLASQLVVSWIYHATWWPPVAHAIVAPLPGPPIP